MLRAYDKAATEPAKRRGRCRLWCLDGLPTVRALLMGPKWKRHFGVQQRSIEEIRPPWWALVRQGRRWVLVFTLEEDVRELVTIGGWQHERFDELRPGVFAMWGD